MISRLLSFALLAVTLWTGPALAAASSAQVVITEGDITDRPYRIIGDVSLTVKKVGIVDRPPIEEKAQNALRAKAVELGADAIILVRYDRHGFTGLSMGRIDVTGRAVVFGSGPAPTSTPSSALPPPAAPSASGAASGSPAPAPSGTLGDAYGTAKVRSYLDAVNSGDINAALGLFDAGAAIEDPIGAQVQQGKAALDAYVRGLVARGSKYELVLPVRGGGTQAAAAVRLRGSTGIQSMILVFTLAPNGNIASLKVYAGAE
jgi:hypothetical protein